MKPKYFALTVCVMLMMFALSACATDDTQVPVEPTEDTTVVEEPVTLRVGTLLDLDCVNTFSCAWWWWYLEGPVYEPYTWYGSDCELIPTFAKSLELSEDGLTWTIELREGVTFSDGEPLNAYTLKDSMDWLNSVEPGGWYPAGLYTVSSEAVDETTLQFTMERPIGSFAEYDSRFVYPYPAHVWSEYDDDTLWDVENYPPIGTGPYVMTDWEVGEYVVLEARDDFWGGDPPIDRVVIQLYTNWDALVSALVAGEIDLTDNALPVQFFNTLEPDPDITVVSRPPGYYYALIFNASEWGTKHVAVDDPIVREAIDYAIDRQQLIDVALLGHGVQCPTDWSCGPFLRMRDPSLEVTPYDPGYANSILDDAGYTDSDGDGIRETPDGEPLTFRLYFDVEDPTEFTFAELLNQSLSAVGIQFELEGLESGTLHTLTTARDFDMFILHYVGEVLPQNVDIYFSCWTAEPSEAPLFNYSGYCDEEVDGFILELLEGVDPAEKQLALNGISQKLNQDRPLIMLAGENTMAAYRHEQFTFKHDYCPGTQGMWDWYSLLNAEVVE
jgi:peptide/nickel transport system substrate-binding protein